MKEATDNKLAPRDKILAIFDYLKVLVLDMNFYGCHSLNIVYEMPQDAAYIRAQVKKQKDGGRALFREILEPIGKEVLADEIYTLFEGALISNKVHSDPRPVISARNIIEKIV